MLVEYFSALLLPLFLPFTLFIPVILIVVGLGKFLKLRQLYVNCLLKVFEFGKERLKRHIECDNDKIEEDEGFCDSSSIISRDVVFRPYDKVDNGTSGKDYFKLSDCLDYVRTGVEAIVEDEVTKRFSAEELTSWNFLTRTNCNYEFISVRLTVFWIIGFIVRYFVLLPIRTAILGIGIGLLVVCTYFVGCFPDGPFKKMLNSKASILCFDFLSGALTLVCQYHNKKDIPKWGICVANHTTPIDVLVLACNNAYDMVGQRHGGLLGIFQWALSRASAHIWFERSEAKDRFAVARRLQDHVKDPNKLPVLIFPEGTCINNTSVMQFKKGTFEVGGVIYPVAIKYDARFGDAFWNSSKYSMMAYLFMMMTSWAIVCDVWYLPPMTIRNGETSVDFANRVKAEIARQGGLVDLVWDGGLKRSAPKKEFRELYQQDYSRRLRLIPERSESFKKSS